MEQVRLKINYYWIIVFIVSCLTACQSNFFEKKISKILDIDDVEVINVTKYEEWAGSQGDGYIMEVYELSEKTIAAFLEKSTQLPLKEGGKKKWGNYGWGKWQNDSLYNEVISLGLNYNAEDEQINKQLNILKEVIKGSYIAFYYSPNRDNPNNIELFILDADNKKLYAIEHQL